MIFEILVSRSIPSLGETFAEINRPLHQSAPLSWRERHFLPGLLGKPKNIFPIRMMNKLVNYSLRHVS